MTTEDHWQLTVEDGLQVFKLPLLVSKIVGELSLGENEGSIPWVYG